MKKILRFIPLGIGIGALFLYIYSRFSFKYISNTAMMASILYNMRIYLYITIISFLAYAFIYLFEFLTRDKNKVKEEIVEEVIQKEDTNLTEEQIDDVVEEQVDMVLEKKYKYCNRCNSLIDIDSKYCKTCGKEQIKNVFVSIIRKIINFIEILILFILVIISVLLVFDYKEKTDPKFESPIKFNLTK